MIPELKKAYQIDFYGNDEYEAYSGVGIFNGYIDIAKEGAEALYGMDDSDGKYIGLFADEDIIKEIAHEMA